MSEVQHTQAEDHRGFQDTISPHIKRALGSLVAGAIIALPQAVTTGLSQAEVQDNLGPIPAIATLSPSSSSLHLGPGGTYFNQRITRNGVGVRVDVRGLPDQLENIADTPPAKLAKPYVAFYQHPETAIKGYSQALQKSFSEKFASSEMQTGGILALAGFAILTAGSTLSGNKRKKLTAATFGGLTLISGLTAYQTLESWQAENQTPSKQFAIGNTNGTVFEGTYADNSLLASVTNRAVPYIRTEAERQQAVNDRFIATSRRSINRELAKGSFAPPSDDQTMVLFISDLHSNFNLIDTYTYLTEQINEMYGDNTLQLSVFFGDQTFGSAAEKGAVDAMANISAETVAINGNHDGKITNEQEKAAGMKVLKGATIKTSQDISILGDDDPTLTTVQALFNLSSNTSRDGIDTSQAEAGETLLTAAEKSKPTILAVHEAAALEPFIGRPISMPTMDEWLQDPKPQSTDALDSVSLIGYGHWHRSFRYQVVRDEEGRGHVVAELPTAGGMGINTLPMPWLVPAKQAGVVLATLDSSSGLVVGLQEVTTETDGSVTFHPYDTIFQPIPDTRMASTKSLGKGPRGNNKPR